MNYIIVHSDLSCELFLSVIIVSEVVMKSITIHGLDDGLDRCIREKAREKGLSINKTLKEILALSFGLSDSLSHDHREEFIDLCGVWSVDDVSEFRKNLQECESVDMSDWQ